MHSLEKSLPFFWLQWSWNPSYHNNKTGRQLVFSVFLLVYHLLDLLKSWYVNFDLFLFCFILHMNMFKKFRLLKNTGATVNNLYLVSDFPLIIWKGIETPLPSILPFFHNPFWLFDLIWGTLQGSPLPPSPEGMEAERVRRWSNLSTVSYIIIPSNCMSYRVHSILLGIRK